MFVVRISPVSEVPKYDIKSVTYPNYIPSNLVYFVDYICNIIYIYVEYYIHIYIYIWTIPKNITKMNIFLKIPYSMSRESYIIYNITSPKYLKKTIYKNQIFTFII